jgi:hypothetical protein
MSWGKVVSSAALMLAVAGPAWTQSDEPARPVAEEQKEAAAKEAEQRKQEAASKAAQRKHDAVRKAEERKKDAVEEAHQRKQEAMKAAAERKRHAEERSRHFAEQKRVARDRRGVLGEKLRDAEQAYRRALELLDAHQWDNAIGGFDHVLAQKGQRLDAALYWKAYAQLKAGRYDDALAALESLESQHAESRWLLQAKMLEVEVKQAAGQPPSPDAEMDDELKLIALSALVDTDPSRAVSHLEKLLLRPNSRRVQERALFVLAQSGTPKAREVLLGIARGQSNPDLQTKAIRHLATMGGPDTAQILDEVLRGAVDPELKRAVLQGLIQVGAQKRVFDIARTESDRDIRRAAIQSLISMGGRVSDEMLLALYQSEKDPDLRREVLRGLTTDAHAGALVSIARKETDPRIKRDVIERLARMKKSKEATDYLLEILEQ